MLVEDRPVGQKERTQLRNEKVGISKLNIKYKRSQKTGGQDPNPLRKYSRHQETSRRKLKRKPNGYRSSLPKSDSQPVKKFSIFKDHSYFGSVGVKKVTNDKRKTAPGGKPLPKTPTNSRVASRAKRSEADSIQGKAHSPRLNLGTSLARRDAGRPMGKVDKSKYDIGISFFLEPFKKSVRNFKNTKAGSPQKHSSANRQRVLQTSLRDSKKKISIKGSSASSVSKPAGRLAATPKKSPAKKGLVKGLLEFYGIGGVSKPETSSVTKKPVLKKSRRVAKKDIQSRPRLGVSLQAQLTLLVGILTIFGLAMVLSASEVSALVASHSPWALFIKQFTYIFMGWFALAFCALRVKISTVKKLTPAIFFVSVVALLVIMAPGIGSSQYGSSRWINFGVFTFQPSELAKLATVLIGAYILDARAKYINDFTNSTRPFLICTAILAGLVVAQPDLGTTIVIASIFFTILFVAKVDLKVISKLAAGAATFGTLYALSATYRRNRLLSFINPMSQVKGPGYQVVQSLIGLHAGHIFGTGLGSSSIKWGFLPNDYTDFIFSIIGQELGLIGSLVVLGLFAYLSFLGIKVAKNARDNYQMLLASGITAWLSFQAFINIGAATGGLPVTGIPLPFVSYGGTQIIISMAAVGIMVNIARQSKLRSSGSSVSSVEKETKRGDKYLVKSGI